MKDKRTDKMMKHIPRKSGRGKVPSPARYKNAGQVVTVMPLSPLLQSFPPSTSTSLGRTMVQNPEPGRRRIMTRKMKKDSASLLRTVFSGNKPERVTDVRSEEETQLEASKKLTTVGKDVESDSAASCPVFGPSDSENSGTREFKQPTRVLRSSKGNARRNPTTTTTSSPSGRQTASKRKRSQAVTENVEPEIVEVESAEEEARLLELQELYEYLFAMPLNVDFCACLDELSNCSVVLSKLFV